MPNVVLSRCTQVTVADGLAATGREPASNIAAQHANATALEIHVLMAASFSVLVVRPTLGFSGEGHLLVERTGFMQHFPKPGDVIYVDTDLYVRHGVDDFRGGRATVIAVTDAWIEVEQNPGTRYNWALLAPKQDALREKFGDAWAHPDPDYRAEFNDDL